jgi:hypothetical protein
MGHRATWGDFELADGRVGVQLGEDAGDGFSGELFAFG